MNTIESKHIICPYCGEAVELLIDCGTLQQAYIEDCSVCCQPFGIAVDIADNGDITVITAREDD